MRFCFGFILMMYGCSLYVFLYKKTRDLLNPLGITIVVWCIVGGISSFQLSYLQRPWSFKMYLAVISFPTFVFISANIVGIKKLHRGYFDKKIKWPASYFFISRLLFIICFLCSVIEWRQQGYTILLFATDVSDKKSMVSAIPVIHYGTIMLSYCPILATFELCYKEKRKDLFFLFFIILWNVFYSLFVLISRGTLITVFLSMLFIISRKYIIKMKTLFISVITALIGFAVIAQMRIWSGSLVFDVIPGYPFLSSIYSYVGLTFENLNKLIYRGANYSLATESFRGVWELVGLKNVLGAKSTETTLFFNAITICYDFYDDLGIMGIILYSTIIYSVVQMIYNKSIVDLKYTILIAALQKAVWMTFFGNYFTSYRSVLIPYIIILFVILSFKIKGYRIKI